MEQVMTVWQQCCWIIVGYVIIALVIAGFLGLVYRAVKSILL